VGAASEKAAIVGEENFGGVDKPGIGHQEDAVAVKRWLSKRELKIAVVVFFLFLFLFLFLLLFLLSLADPCGAGSRERPISPNEYYLIQYTLLSIPNLGIE